MILFCPHTVSFRITFCSVQLPILSLKKKKKKKVKKKKQTQHKTHNGLFLHQNITDIQWNITQCITETSSLEIPFRKHHRWSSLLISFGHVNMRKKSCWEKKAKNRAGKTHAERGTLGQQCRHQCPNFFFLQKKKNEKKKQSNQQTSSHILSPWWIAVSRGPLPLLPQHLHSNLIPRLPFSTFSHRIFLPSCLCTPSHFPHPVKSLTMFMLLSLACVKVQTPSRQGLPQSPWGVPAGLGLWSRSGQPIK